MLKEKRSKKILLDFDIAYKKWIDSHQDCKVDKKSSQEWAESVKYKYSLKKIAQGIYPDWKKLHDIDKQNGELLIKKMRDFFVVLLTQYNFGDDIFKDYDIKIKATYKNAHLRKLK